jgi:archaetidylinositol phosphate synthase
MMKNNRIENHHRVNDILLGPLERPVLEWMAVHTPARISPDFCTVLGVFGAAIVFCGYWWSTLDRNFLWLASLGFVINWAGDSLDGTLARYRHIERPVFGFYVDHTLDAVSQTLIFLGLGLSPYVHFTVGCLILIAYMLLSIQVYVRTCAAGEFKISFGRLGPTEIRVLAVLLNVVMYFAGVRTITWQTGPFGLIAASPYDVVVAAIALILVIFFFTSTVQEAVRLSKIDR